MSRFAANARLLLPVSIYVELNGDLHMKYNLQPLHIIKCMLD